MDQVNKPKIAFLFVENARALIYIGKVQSKDKNNNLEINGFNMAFKIIYNDLQKMIVYKIF